MKRGAPGHPKVALLANLLEVPKYSAVGLLEMLWHFTAQYARAGDVGRFGDDEIAGAVGWKDDPAILVTALVKAGWLDPSKKHRLTVHHWHDHADDAVHMSLARAGLRFAHTNQIPKLGRLTKDEKTEAERTYASKSVRTQSAQGAHEKRTAQPSQAKPEPEPEPEPRPAPPGPADMPDGNGDAAHGGAGLGDLGRSFADAGLTEIKRKSEVAQFLGQLKTRSGKTISQEVKENWIGREDITVARLKRVLDQIRTEKDIDDPLAVLVVRIDPQRKKHNRIGVPR